MNDVFATADAAVQARADDVSRWTAQLFDWAEPAWREYRSAEWYVRQLRAEGFTVEEGSAGMPTAFCAEWRNGDGPVVGMYAEYDAVPGNCQAARPERAPTTGWERWRPATPIRTRRWAPARWRPAGDQGRDAGARHRAQPAGFHAAPSRRLVRVRRSSPTGRPPPTT